MMNWNNNDTKYILKRIILYLLISCIVFFAGQRCAKAQIVTSHTSGGFGVNGNDREHYLSTEQQNSFRAAGNGYIVGNYWVNPGQPNYVLKNLTADVIADNGNVYKTVCEIGNQEGFTDSQVEYHGYTFKCPVAIGSDAKLRGITATFIANNREGWWGDYITFVSDNNEANQIVSGINNAINNMNGQSQTNAQAIQNAINTATQNEINAINNQTTAINNQTTVITDTNNYLKEDYQFDANLFSDVSGLLQQSDTDFIRTILLFPLTLYTIIGDVLTSGQCVQVNFGSLLGTNLYLPCINWKTYVGDTVYVAIDTIFSMVILAGFYTYVKNTIKALFTLGAEGYNQIDVEVFK